MAQKQMIAISRKSFTFLLVLASVGFVSAETEDIQSALEAAYGASLSFQQHDNGAVSLILSNKTLPIEVRPGSSLEEMLERGGIGDMFQQIYPLEPFRAEVMRDFDPGRVRNDALFKYLYGNSKQEVSQNLIDVGFCGQKVKFNKRHGAAEALASVSEELQRLAAGKPELRAFTRNLGGTFAWRTIAGTERLSAHSFGIAIDLEPAKGRYWRWDSGKKRPSWEALAWPHEIISAFEKHGFIWGGKWWHYDTFHFEYRPELIAYAKLLQTGEHRAD